MAGRKLVLIHGYSDQGASFAAWASKLRDRGIQAEGINICNYISLNNEVTIPDIAEGLARAADDLGWAADQEFDAVVHSTGMLVIRAWLANSRARRNFLKHLIGLAPATWGSPLAHLGRSWLGSLVRGNKEFGPDFLNAGDRVLDALELGSRFTWDLAHRDLLCESPLFTTGPDSPYVAVFIGNQPYTGIRELVDKPGMDGTVRWSGCGLNARKITVDLRKSDAPEQRVQVVPWATGRLSVPMFAVDGKNHTTLLREPDDDLADLIVKFLSVSSADEYADWVAQAKLWDASAFAKMKTDKKGQHDGWQQFVIRVTDEYGEAVPDYAVDLFRADPTGLDGQDLQDIEVQEFDLDVHAYSSDPSLRCFHVRIPLNTTGSTSELWLRLTASTGTELLAYQGYAPDSKNVTEQTAVVLNISHLVAGEDELFRPFTTTLVEMKLTREPLPFKGQTKLMAMKVFGQ